MPSGHEQTSSIQAPKSCSKLIVRLWRFTEKLVHFRPNKKRIAQNWKYSNFWRNLQHSHLRSSRESGGAKHFSALKFPQCFLHVRKKYGLNAPRNLLCITKWLCPNEYLKSASTMSTRKEKRLRCIRGVQQRDC